MTRQVKLVRMIEKINSLTESVREAEPQFDYFLLAILDKYKASQ